jgi:phosphoserine phosphatase
MTSSEIASSFHLYASSPNLQSRQLDGFKQEFGSFITISPNAVCWALQDHDAEKLTLRARALGLAAKLDISVVPASRKISDFKLAAFDMDSTLITIECIDEIADYIGKKAEVAAITEAAMRGEISDYQESLRRRVALLRGLPVSALQRVYDERLSLTEGAQSLVDYLKSNGLKTLLVSGGFTFFTDRLKVRLGLDFSRSNELEIYDGKLTGQLVGPIVDAEVKRQVVLQTSVDIGCSATQCIAVGDGANDLKMMSVAGLSLAYKAKPVVQQQAKDVINFGGLDTAIAWLSNEAK